MFLKPAATASKLQDTVDSILNSFDLRSAFTVLPIFRPGGEGEEDEDEGNDEGNGDEGGEGNDDGASGTGDQTGSDIKDPEKKRLSDEAGRYRTALRQAEKERNDLAAWKKQVEDADKTEVEQLKGQVADVTKERDGLATELTQHKLELAFYKCGAAAQLRDPSDALKFLDLKEIKVDEDGEVPTEDMKKAVDTLIKSKPYLARTDDDDSGEGEGSGEGQPSGRQTNGRKTKKDADQAALEKKFPALRGRQPVS